MLQIEGLRARFGDREVLRGIDLQVPDGAVVSILGPSGSGKTTLLRAIAGLEPVAGGTIRWDGRDLHDVPVHERGFGLMFQDYALFLDRNVVDNVEFGLRMQSERWHDPAARSARVAEVLRLVGLEGLDRRAVSRLSGGEQQRVALARTLAPSPSLVMLDEPLGSLDRGVREQLPMELRRIFASVGATVLYVTHDQEEALGVADRTIVLHDGSVEADAPPEQLWQRPPNAWVARFLGFADVAPATVDGRGTVHTPWGPLPDASTETMRTGLVLIRPDAFSPDPAGPISGVVEARTFRGDHVRVRLAVPGAPPLEVDARWTPLPAIGDHLTLRVDPAGVVLLPGSED